MWIPGGISYMVAALALVSLSLRESEARTRRREARMASIPDGLWSAT